MSKNFYQHNNARHAQSQIPTKEKSSSELSRGRSPLLSQRRSLSNPSVSEDNPSSALLHAHALTRESSLLRSILLCECYMNVSEYN